MRSVNGQYEEIGIKWPFPWPEMSIPWPQISLWPSYLLNSISEKYISKFIYFFRILWTVYSYIQYVHVLLSIEILIKNSCNWLSSWSKYMNNQFRLVVYSVSVAFPYMEFFECISLHGKKNISFFLTGDLQITFLRNKSSWPKMTGNYWAIKLCARPLMHRSGIWFIKKEKRSRVKKDRVARPDRSEWPGQMLTLQPKQLLLQGLHCLLEFILF